MQADGMQVKLSWVDIQKGEIRQPLLNTPITFGRTLASMPEQIDGQRVSRMVLADAQVDPYHALLEVHEGQLRINDRGSRSGTPVNDVTLPYQPVNKGDRIQIGPYTIHITAISRSAETRSRQKTSSNPSAPPPRPAPPRPPSARPKTALSPSTPLPPPPPPQPSPISSENVGVPLPPQPTSSLAAPAPVASPASYPSPSASHPLTSSLNQTNTGQTLTNGQFDLDGTCNRQVGFLFKRRCGRTSTAGCSHCQNGRSQDDPFFYDYDTYYPGYGRYNRGYWGHSYYRDRHRYYYDSDRRSTDFTEADGESFEQEGDQDYEMDLDAS